MKIKHIEIVNFRKLLATRIDISESKTVFVGANNSGKTSAMDAFKLFLAERGKLVFSDITLSRWSEIDSLGNEWGKGKQLDVTILNFLPHLDIWLDVNISEAFHVRDLIPSLTWNGGLLGVRIVYEPINFDDFQKAYLAARSKVNKQKKKTGKVKQFPQSLSDFLKNNIQKFKRKFYSLDIRKFSIPDDCGIANPQKYEDGAEPFDVDPITHLIKIDIIQAQRGFSNERFSDESENESRARRLSSQLRRYYSKHLDPTKEPGEHDLEALEAIKTAEEAFDERLKKAFASSLDELNNLGYPGIADPSISVATELRPIDGLRHDAAVQYDVPVHKKGKTTTARLPEESNGLGYQNLISMVFRLIGFRDEWMRVGKVSEGNEKQLYPLIHLVLIEEPEAHLHTQVQQVFVRKAYEVLRNHPILSDKNSPFTSQLVISTHPSHIAHECNFSSLRYFRRMPTCTQGLPTVCVANLGDTFGTDPDTERFVKRYLKVVHCDLFFADAIILLEGAAERMLIPYFIQNNNTYKQLAASYITCMEIGGSHAYRLKPLITKLGLTTLVITDLDAEEMVEMTDKNGKRKKVTKACVTKRGVGQKTGNTSLDKWHPQKNSIDDLLAFNPDKLFYHDDTRHFGVYIAYQQAIECNYNTLKGEFLARTFEDALIASNINYFASYSGGSKTISNVTEVISKSTSNDELGAELFTLVNSKSFAKSEFALDILLTSNSQNIELPKYISLGLGWLDGVLKGALSSMDISIAK